MFQNAHGALINTTGFTIIAVNEVDVGVWHVDVDANKEILPAKKVRFTLVQHQFGRMKGSWMTKQLVDR